MAPPCCANPCPYGMGTCFMLSNMSPELKTECVQKLNITEERLKECPTSRVCEHHFTSDSVVLSGNRKLLKKLKATLKSDETLNDVDNVCDHAEKYMAEFVSHGWIIIPRTNFWTIFLFDSRGEGGIEVYVKKTLSLKRDLTIEAHFDGKPVKLSQNSARTWQDLKKLISELNTLDEIDGTEEIGESLQKILKILERVQFEDGDVEKNTFLMKILANQLSNCQKKEKQQFRYDKQTMLLAFALYTQSSTAYLIVRQFLYLPTVDRLNKLSSKMQNLDNQVYFKRLYDSLKHPHQRYVCLQIDEIRTLTEGDKDPEVATGAMGVSMQSMTDSMTDSMTKLVKLVPVKKCDGKKLDADVLDVIEFVQSIGFVVVLLLTDNHRINQNMFTVLTNVEDGENLLYFPNPTFPEKKIFVKFDPVHICKVSMLEASEGLKGLRDKKILRMALAENKDLKDYVENNPVAQVKKQKIQALVQALEHVLNKELDHPFNNFEGSSLEHSAGYISSHLASEIFGQNCLDCHKRIGLKGATGESAFSQKLQREGLYVSASTIDSCLITASAIFQEILKCPDEKSIFLRNSDFGGLVLAELTRIAMEPIIAALGETCKCGKNIRDFFKPIYQISANIIHDNYVKHLKEMNKIKIAGQKLASKLKRGTKRRASDEDS